MTHERTAGPRVENPRLTGGEGRHYHVWFSPKNRHALLEGELGEVVLHELNRAADEHEVKVLSCRSGYDHVHLLLELNPATTLPSVMHALKGASAHRIFSWAPDLKMDVRQRSFWQRGYGYRQVPPGNLETVRQYIEVHAEEDEPEPRVFNPRVRNEV